jgi:signal transduction histidine kinase/CheY-like chemotaxis protein
MMGPGERKKGCMSSIHLTYLSKLQSVKATKGSPQTSADHPLASAQSHPPNREPLIFLAGLFAAYVAICILYVDRMDGWSRDQAAIDSAERYTDVVSAFRTTYTSKVVPKVKARGMAVTHDSDQPNAIPLPATMSILIGEQLAKEKRGLQVRLYSPYPFPWRTESGLFDEFAKTTWQVLNRDSGKSHHQFTESEGKRFIRYAVADVMRPECVTCHNTHPQSPKKDWRKGDVRGVLEVRFPVVNDSETQAPLFGMIFLFLVGCAAFLVVAVILRRLESHSEEIRISDAKLAAAHLEIQQSKQRVVEEKLTLVGHVAAGIAHDFNNVLMIVLGYTDMAIKHVPEGTKISNYLEKSRFAIRRAKALANKLPIVHSHHVFRPLHVDLYEVITKTVDLLHPLISGAETELKISPPKEPIKVLAEPDQIERMLINLVLNAVDVMAGKGTIWISAESRRSESLGNKAVITVRDTGPGITEDVRPHLFEPFFTSKDSGDTAGLGLFTVQQIVEQHGGSVEVESSPGEGATFRIVLPLEYAEAGHHDESTESSCEIRPATPAQILLVDDDAAVRQYLMTALTQNDHLVTVAGDGEEAMEIFGERADDFALIITDIRMPKMDGREFARAVREIRPQQSLLFISGYEEDGAWLQQEFRRSAPFLKKPFGPLEFVALVESTLRKEAEA